MEYKIYGGNDEVMYHDFSILNDESTFRAVLKNMLKSVKGKYAEYKLAKSRKWKTIANF